jgi:tetratricopeptide (TPR) repeat protein
MSEMPERPREHVLGDEAQDAFRLLLPKGWIYRSKPSDYGIDGEVELTSAEGQLTGRLFYVQLKGTDTISLEEALKIRLKISTVNYFRALDLPVLIVRYHAPTTKIYVRWFESVSSSLPEAGQDTVSIKFSEEDEFTSTRSATISNELEGIRLIKFNKLTLPVGATIGCRSGQQIRGFSAAEIVSAVKSLVSTGIVRFKPDVPIAVEIGTDQTDITIGIVYKMSVQTDTLFSHSSLQVSAANILAAIGIALGRVRQGHAGATLILSSARQASLLNSFPYGLEAAFCLAADNRTAEALQVANSIISGRDSLALMQIMGMVPILARSMPNSSGLWTELLRKIVVETETRGDMKLCAAARYNLANHLHSIGQRREALHYYHLALRADPRYSIRNYIWRELGALLFKSMHYRWAAVCYKRAVELGDDECEPFLADALMWSGEYDQAMTMFEAYLKKIQYPSSEWVLTGQFVRVVRERVGCGTQRRNRVLALQLASARENTFEESQFTAAVQADGLCGLAWFNRAFWNWERKITRVLHFVTPLRHSAG